MRKGPCSAVTAIELAEEAVQEFTRAVALWREAGSPGGGAEVATVKRRSMDLTRALPDVRHPWRES